MIHFDGYFLFQLFDVIMQWTQRCPLLPVTNVSTALRRVNSIRVCIEHVVAGAACVDCYLT